MKRAYISREIRRLVALDARHRCGYCLSDEFLMGMALSIEHIIPVAVGGTSARENLWMSCRPCNEFKNDRIEAADPNSGMLVAIFNPRMQKWNEHFQFDESGTLVIGITPTGRATTHALQLNRSLLVKARKRWILSGWPLEIDLP